MSADLFGPAPRVFSIAPGSAFLPALADALLGRVLLPDWPVAGDPLSLSEGTIYLPTRRAARALAALIAERAGGEAVLLPRIVPLGDVEEAEENLILDGLGPDGSAHEDLPPEAGETARRLALAELILAWSREVDRAMLRLRPDEPLLVPASPADAVALAGDLGRLIDTLAIHGKACEDIHRLVPDEFGEYWRITRDFLAIAAEAWPALCRERGLMDAALRRSTILEREAERMERERPEAPVIAAGSTGSQPATAALLKAIARLPRGAVVLPGLDRHLDEPSWRAILAPTAFGVDGHPGHPQAILAQLLRRFGIAREEVVELGRATPALAAREALVSEALRPAETTHLWAGNTARFTPALLARALEGVVAIEAADDREEACAIAALLRETLERPGETAALVTPDRSLAERVAAELRRWQVLVDDSAGLPLERSPAGVLARLVAECAAAQAQAHLVLALLAHPLCRLGLPQDVLQRGRVALEIGVLRGPAAAPGFAGIEAALARRREGKSRHDPAPRQRLESGDWEAARAVVGALAAAFASFRHEDGRVDLAALVAAHDETCRAVLQAAPDWASEPDPSEEMLAALFDDVKGAAGRPLPGRFADYPGFFLGLCGGRTLQRGGAGHRRIKIWGLLEARLLSADTIVLGGLDERTWPPETRSDAFLNRPMRRELGLPSPERRIGQTAHDLCQAMGAPRVVLTRAAKRAGDPAVPSRFLQRLEAVAGPAWAGVRARGEDWLRLARALDRPLDVAPLRRPEPKPPAAAQPVQLSVTEIETLVRDPYAVYAKRVLRLDPLDPVATPPSAALRGTLIHGVIGDFARSHPDALPDDAVARLLALGQSAFDAAPELRDRPDIRAFWWPRFRRIVEFVAEWEASRREPGTRIIAETYGKLTIDLPDGGLFTLTGQADRFELRPGGGLAVVDFKTGGVPGVPEVRVGFSPQLTLEAAMARRGAFPGIAEGEIVSEALYVKLSGGREAGKVRRLADPKDPFDVAELAEDHLARLTEMLAEFRAGTRGWRSRTATKYAKRYNPFDHLARFAEWSLTGGAGGEAAEGEGET